MAHVCEVLQDEVHLQNFGKCYLKVMQSTVLKKKNNLTTVKLDVWKRKELKI